MTRPVFTIGATDIPYDVRFSPKATRKRIIVTPEGVEVVVPVGTPVTGHNGILAFLHRKRRWLFDAVRDVQDAHQKLLTQHYASGAKLQYRGRWLMLNVQSDAIDRVLITCQSKFHVRVPQTLDGVDRLEATRAAFNGWLKERARRDMLRLGRKYQKALGVKAKGFQLSEAKTHWGLLTRGGTVRLHWRLVQAPMAALEYVVAHEITHLIVRNHSPEFWATLSRILPDWSERKALLERWEGEHRAV